MFQRARVYGFFVRNSPKEPAEGFSYLSFRHLQTEKRPCFCNVRACPRRCTEELQSRESLLYAPLRCARFRASCGAAPHSSCEEYHSPRIRHNAGRAELPFLPTAEGFFEVSLPQTRVRLFLFPLQRFLRKLRPARIQPCRYALQSPAPPNRTP